MHEIWLYFGLVIILILTAVGWNGLKRAYACVKILFLFWSLRRSAKDLKSMLKNPNAPKYQLERAQRSVLELRKGKQFVDEYSIQFIEEAVATGWSYRKIGTTKEEFEEFKRGGSQKIFAKKLLESYRKKPDYTLQLESALKNGKLEPEDIGTTSEELRSFNRAYWIPLYTRNVEELRAIAAGHGKTENVYKRFEPNELVESVTRAVENRGDDWGLTLADFGTSREELDDLLKKAWFASAKEWWETTKEEGACQYFKPLHEMLAGAGAQLSDLGITEADMEALARESYLRSARRELEKLRNPGEKWFGIFEAHEGVKLSFSLAEHVKLPGDPEKIVERLRTHLKEANASPEEIGTSENEITNLLRDGYVYAATFLIGELRRISHTPRVSNLEKMQRIIPPSSRIMITAENKEKVKELEPQYPYERDIAAIRAYLEKARAPLERAWTSEDEIEDIKRAFAAR